MAKPNRISFTDGHIAYNPTFSPEDLLASAPPSATPAKQVTTGQEQSNSLTAGPVGQAAQSYVSQQLRDSLGKGFEGAPAQGNPINPETYRHKGQYGNTWKPTVYNQNTLNQYDAGLQEAQNMDAQAGFNGFNQRIYQLLHGNRSEAQLTQYVPQASNAAMQRQTANLGDGSAMQNPNTNPELALQWNVQNLRQQHPDWSEEQIQQYMSQPFNWQSAQALTNAGIWEPTEQSRAWTAYQEEQARREAEARAAALAAQQASSYSGGDYHGGGSSDDDDDPSIYKYTQSESDARSSANGAFNVRDNPQNMDYTNPELYSPPRAFGWLRDLF